MTPTTSRGQLEFRLAWDERSTNAESAADWTWGTMTVLVAGDVVWGRTKPKRWTWSDLLAWLTNSWPWLVHEDGWPFPRVPNSAADIPQLEREELLEYFDLPDRRLEREQEFFEFRQRHDVSTGLPGTAPPDVWVVRRGHYVDVVTPRRRHVLALDFVLDALTSLGDQIAQRLADCRDPHAQDLRQQWRERDNLESTELFEIATGLKLSRLHEISHALDENESSLETVFQWRGQRAQSEPLALTRMAAAVAEPTVIATILQVAREVARGGNEELARLARLARDRVNPDVPPFAQGYAVAEWLRTEASRDVANDVNAFISKTLGVPIHRRPFENFEIDAVALWGTDGCAVVLNTTPNSTARERITLAHELCHLLLDRRDALPVAEVLGGDVPQEIEQRARAFAAELLAPRADVLANLRGNELPQALVERVAQRFGVSTEVIGWQVSNGLRAQPTAEINPTTVSYCRTLVRDPDRF